MTGGEPVAATATLGSTLRRRWPVALAVAVPVAVLGLVAVWEPPTVQRTSVSVLAPDDLVQPAQLTRFTSDVAAALRSPAVLGPDGGPDGELTVQRVGQSAELVVRLDADDAVDGAADDLVTLTERAVTTARSSATARAEQRLESARESEAVAAESLGAVAAERDALLAERGGIPPSVEMTRLVTAAAELRVCAVAAGPEGPRCAAELDTVGDELAEVEAAVGEEQRLDETASAAQADVAATRAARRAAELDLAGISASAPVQVLGEHVKVDRYAELARKVIAVVLAAAVLGIVAALLPTLLRRDASR